ncbi:MAG: N-acetylmuramoyl-L-alanine amidase [Actinomycetota bacterium]
MRWITISLVVVGVVSTSHAAAPPSRFSAVRTATKPHVVGDHIPYGAQRKRQMARYSRRHYGRARWRLRRPRVIVLHFTGGTSYSSAWNHFASNTPARGELPGVCTHYIVGKDGTIHALVRSSIRCRHTIGLNHRAIGIEMVQKTGVGSHWAAQQILGRRRQIRRTLRLTAWLKAKHGIAMRDVIGHAMANDSRRFKDLQGWTNDHTDWLERDVKVFRRRLRRMT